MIVITRDKFDREEMHENVDALVIRGRIRILCRDGQE